MNTTFVSTSIPYVNGAPHLGHALEFVQADTFARFRRLLGRDVRLLSGTDDNSLNNVLAAARDGVPVADLVKHNTLRFRRLLDALDISQDDFLQTSVDRRHVPAVHRLWQACADNGDVYPRTYRGLYCTGCELFYTPADLAPSGGLCPEHLEPPETVEEHNYFFRLSRYGPRLAQLIDSGSLRIVPDSRRNEVRALIERGLEDFSISRSHARARGWGIPVPNDPQQIIYVWFDALANYISALDYGTRGDLFARYWEASDERLHTIGKGIVRFHAVYWPAILLSAGLPLPTTLFVHGYLTVDGHKISKSRGNGVDPFGLIETFGADAVRYWLLRGVPPTGDADFSLARLQGAYTADLARDLGNLVHRVLSLLRRYADGRVPERACGPNLAGDLAQGVCSALDADLDPRAALACVWEVVARANRYADQAAPWREPDARARDAALSTLAEGVRVIGEALRPLLPATAASILEWLGTSPAQHWLPALTWGQLVPGTLVQSPRPLFPRLE